MYKKYFKNKTVCVTGGAGFIGSHLVKELSNYDCKIIIIDNLSTGRLNNIKEFIKNKNIEFIKKDLSKIKNLKTILNKTDYIFHLAGTYRYEVDIDDCIYQSLLIKKDILSKSWSGPVVGEEFKIK